MKQLISALIASVAFLTIGGPVLADSHMNHMKMNTMKVAHMCPRGKHWINGYMRNHHRVAGYCRRN